MGAFAPAKRREEDDVHAFFFFYCYLSERRHPFLDHVRGQVGIHVDIVLLRTVYVPPPTFRCTSNNSVVTFPITIHAGGGRFCPFLSSMPIDVSSDILEIVDVCAPRLCPVTVRHSVG